MDTFIYEAFLRENPPSIFRLGIKEVVREGKLSFKNDPVKFLNTAIDKAIIIRNAINRSSIAENNTEISNLHKLVLSR